MYESESVSCCSFVSDSFETPFVQFLALIDFLIIWRAVRRESIPGTSQGHFTTVKSTPSQQEGDIAQDPLQVAQGAARQKTQFS